MELYGRHIELRIDKANSYNKTLVSYPIDNKVFSIDFNIPFGTNEVSTIRLYNSLDSTYGMCLPDKSTKKYSTLELQAGYRNDVALILVGDIVQISHIRQGADKILEIKALPRAFDLFNTFISQSFVKYSVKNIIEDLCDVSNIPVYFDEFIKNNPIIPEISFSDSLDSCLNHLCKLLNAKKDFQKGKLYIISKADIKQSINYNDIPKINNDTGMIGYPEFRNNLWKIKTLLNPAIFTNSQIFIEFYDLSSAAIIGNYYSVLKGKHYGSSFAQDYYTEVECKRLD